LAVLFEEVEVVEHADHDLGVGKVFAEGFVRDVVEGLAARLADGGEIFGLERGYGAGLKSRVVGNAVDGKTIGDGLGELLLGGFFVAHFLVEGGARGGHHLVEFLLRVRQAGNSLQNLLAREFGMGVVGRILRLIFQDGLNIVAAKILLDFGKAVPLAEGAETFVGHLLREKMSGSGANEGLFVAEQGDEGVAGFAGSHGAVEKKGGGVRIEIEGVFGDVDDGVGIEKELGSKGADVDAGLTEGQSDREVSGRIGFLEIGLHQRIADEIARFRRRIDGEKHAGGIELEDVIGFFCGEERADARNPFGTRGLNLFPEGVDLFGLGVELGFVELGEMEAVGFGFFGSEFSTGGGIVGCGWKG